MAHTSGQGRCKPKTSEWISRAHSSSRWEVNIHKNSRNFCIPKIKETYFLRYTWVNSYQLDEKYHVMENNVISVRLCPSISKKISIPFQANGLQLQAISVRLKRVPKVDEDTPKIEGSW